MSALLALLRDRIEEGGPLDLADYMAVCLAHPEHGYYATRDPFGTGGDFVTAPEISQAFGELIGLSLGQAWIDQSAPPGTLLTELGPGRGTLMADAWRALKAVPEAQTALQVHLVERSAHLRAVQAGRLTGLPAAWHERIEGLPAGPLLLIANEFLDALPVHQLVRRADGWRERKVGLDGGGRLRFVEEALSPGLADHLPALLSDASEGAIAELAPRRTELVETVARRIAGRGGLALLVDYGAIADGPTGDTLQAVRNHRPADPLEAPGLADLTAQVDFGPLIAAARATGAAVFGPLPQGTFLRRLGIEERIGALVRAAGHQAAPTLLSALQRLVHPTQMGEAFKVLALQPADAPLPPGFLDGERAA